MTKEHKRRLAGAEAETGLALIVQVGASANCLWRDQMHDATWLSTAMLEGAPARSSATSACL